MNAGTLGGTDQCSKIMRIFNFIKNENKRWFVFPLSNGENFFYLNIAIGIDDGNNALSLKLPASSAKRSFSVSLTGWQVFGQAV